MEQTAVEWLISEWLRLDRDYYEGTLGRIDYLEKREEAHNAAKSRFEQQIINAWNDGLWGKLREGEDNARQYYNETFKS